MGECVFGYGTLEDYNAYVQCMGLYNTIQNMTKSVNDIYVRLYACTLVYIQCTCTCILSLCVYTHTCTCICTCNMHIHTNVIPEDLYIHVVLV